MKANDFAQNIISFFAQVDIVKQKQGGMRAFVSDDGEGSLYAIEDPLDKHNLSLDQLSNYAFVQFEQDQIRTLIGYISKIYGRNHETLTEERGENKFPYDFLLIIEAPLPVRIWCEDFSDFVAIMKELKTLMV